MPLPNPGETLLDKYKLGALLGKGGMGAVYAARHVQLDEPVAIKFLLPELAARKDLANRFVQEARAGRRIKSSHVATVHDIDRADGVPFIVMEHLEGETLATCLARRGPLPVEEAVDYVLQAGEAVNEAHTLGIVHRDLKPANLFVTNDERGRPFIKVLDFGISKFEDVSQTSTDSALGTPLYMSPEQLADSGKVDARSDVWSLGIVLFELLAGKRPFEGESRALIHAAVKSGRRPKLSELRDDAPPRLEAAIDKALVVSLAERTASVEDFAASIVQFGTKAGGASFERIQIDAERAGSGATAPSEEISTAPLARRVDTAPGGEGTLSLGGAVETPPPTALPTPPPAPEPAAVSSRRPWAWVGAVALSAIVAFVGARSYWFSHEGPTAASGPCAAGATPACEAACTAREPGACHALAEALDLGKGAPANPKRAADLFQEECGSGGMAGCNALGQMHATGDGMVVDNAAARDLFDRACRAGFARGCVNLGSMHYEGLGMPKDEVAGASLFRRGCVAGDMYGCAELSMALSAGRGVRQDVDEAFAMATKACLGENALGCALVERARILGAGVAKDVKGGLAKLDAMCTGGKIEGCRELIAAYGKGLGDVKPDKVRMDGYVDEACKVDPKRSCGGAHLEELVDLTATNPAKHYETLRRMCDEEGRMKMCEMLGRALIDGSSIPKDPLKGAAYLAKACSGGVKTACGG